MFENPAQSNNLRNINRNNKLKGEVSNIHKTTELQIFYEVKLK